MGILLVKSINYIEGENNELEISRELKIQLSNDSVVTAVACHESWEQWGGCVDDLYLTQPIVEAHNEWLHGGDLPFN